LLVLSLSLPNFTENVATGAAAAAGQAK